MMSAQGNLNLGAGAFVSQIHGNTSRSLIGLVVLGRYEKIQFYHLDAAVRHANDYGAARLDDCFLSINGFFGPRRLQANVNQLNGFWIDFDYNKIPEYKDMECPDFMAMVLMETPKLPAPTIILDSGGGCWAYWLFDKPMMMETKHAARLKLPVWREHQVELIRALLKYGADPAAGDASRLTRMAETVNSKNFAYTSAWTTGVRHKPKTIMAAIMALAPKRIPSPAIQARPVTPGKSKRKSNNLKRLKFTPYSMAHDRMSDLRSIARMRGGYQAGHCRMAYFFYAVCMAFYHGSSEGITAECDEFAREFFDKPEKYTDGKIDIQDVTRRAVASYGRRLLSKLPLLPNLSPRPDGKGRFYHRDNPHTITNQFIIDALGITLDEMNGANGEDELKMLISPALSAKREMRRRRAAGVKPLDDYRAELAAATQRKREEAQALRDQGMTVKAIAEAQGCTTKTVQRRLSA